jgi:XTP/dITP diphosphohydrolase
MPNTHMNLENKGSDGISDRFYLDASEAFGRLLTIMNELREKCPWDQKQTFESLRPLTLEEVYELSESILEKDIQGISKELGDVLLHLVFYAKIGQEKNEFSIIDVINKLCEKLIFRHPHIYGEVVVKDEADVKRNWEQLKIKEGNKSVLGGVPSSLPALIKASRIQEKAAGVGFDWVDSEDVWRKVLEEVEEFRTEIQSVEKQMEGKPDKIAQDKIDDEFGDILFSLVNYARFKKINPENALEMANKKFQKRFLYIEEKIRGLGLELKPENVEMMEKLWDEAKLFA